MTHELGPMPSCDRDAGWHRIYTAEQMRAYALAEVESALAHARHKHALETGALISRLRDCQGVIMRMRDPAIQGGIDMEQAIQECLAREVIK